MKRFRNIAVAMLAFGLIAAACGGDDAESTTTVAPTTTMAEEMTEAGTIVEVASDAGAFSTLLTAAEAAGLVDTLNSEGPYTVFAPTDEAFAALPEGTLEALLADPAALADILLYHVVPGEVFAADVVGLDSATSAQGEAITITINGETVTLNGSANVVTTDVDASNGVIHIIDAVILPPSS
jgi:uncharacterized surface protein with fasciclin (FAS1) repeats